MSRVSTRGRSSKFDDIFFSKNSPSKYIGSDGFSDDFRATHLRLRRDGAPPAPGQEHCRNTLEPDRYRGPRGADQAGEQAEMDEANHADPDADREHAVDAAAHLGRRREIDQRRLHDAEAGL